MSIVADFRLLNYIPGQRIYFAAIPSLLPAMAQYGTVTATNQNGVYELDPHPLVDWFGLITRLEQISGWQVERE